MELNVFVEDYIKKNHPEVSEKVQSEIVNAIRAGYYFAKGSNEAIDEDSPEFINSVYREAKQIFNNKNLSWATKYDLILSDNISSKVNYLFNYYDPDTDYEDDVRAFMDAFTEYIERNYNA